MFSTLKLQKILALIIMALAILGQLGLFYYEIPAVLPLVIESSPNTGVPIIGPPPEPHRPPTIILFLGILKAGEEAQIFQSFIFAFSFLILVYSLTADKERGRRIKIWLKLNLTSLVLLVGGYVFLNFFFRKPQGEEILFCFWYLTYLSIYLVGLSGLTLVIALISPTIQKYKLLSTSFIAGLIACLIAVIFTFYSEPARNMQQRISFAVYFSTVIAFPSFFLITALVKFCILRLKSRKHENSQI